MAEPQASRAPPLPGSGRRAGAWSGRCHGVLIVGVQVRRQPRHAARALSRDFPLRLARGPANRLAGPLVICPPCGGMPALVPLPPLLCLHSSIPRPGYEQNAICMYIYGQLHHTENKAEPHRGFAPMQPIRRSHGRHSAKPITGTMPSIPARRCRWCSASWTNGGAARMNS